MLPGTRYMVVNKTERIPALVEVIACVEINPKEITVQINS